MVENHLKYTLLIVILFLVSFSIAAQEMVSIEGAQVEIGYAEGTENEKPVFQTIIKNIMMDKNLITVGQFRLFVNINRYVTEAERKGEGYIFDTQTKTWKAIKGAYWKYPLGPQEPAAKSHEPVRQISWNDAQAYAVWVGKRLPHEFELEHAIKNAEKLGIQQLNGSIWQWADNWYQDYAASDYYRTTLNREKTLKGGTPREDIPFRASVRVAAFPYQMGYDIGFRCVKEVSK